MQVTVLLALLWNTEYDPLPPVDGIEPAPVKIPQEEIDRLPSAYAVRHTAAPAQAV